MAPQPVAFASSQSISMMLIQNSKPFCPLTLILSVRF